MSEQDPKFGSVGEPTGRLKKKTYIAAGVVVLIGLIAAFVSYCV